MVICRLMYWFITKSCCWKRSEKRIYSNRLQSLQLLSVAIFFLLTFSIVQFNNNSIAVWISWFLAHYYRLEVLDGFGLSLVCLCLHWFTQKEMCACVCVFFLHLLCKTNVLNYNLRRSDVKPSAIVAMCRVCFNVSIWESVAYHICYSHK